MAITTSTKQCGNCEQSRKEFCARCKFCKRCCVCKHCAECRDIFAPSHFCPSCGECRSVPCVCRRHIPNAFVDKPPRAVRKINRMPRLIGMELEIANWNNLLQSATPTAYRYRAVHDGSVQPSGNEMVVEPLAGDAFLSGAWQIAEHLAAHRCTVNNTCGFHVHIDGRDIDMLGMRRLIQLYSKLEPEIYASLISAERYNSATKREQYYPESRKAWNMHIPRLYSTDVSGEIKCILEEVLYGVSYPQTFGKPPSTLPGRCISCGAKLAPPAVPGRCEICKQRWISVNQNVSVYKRDKYGGVRQHGLRTRYWGFNLHSWMHRGTIEFRMKEGTVDLADIICWPLFCGWMVHLASQLNDSQIAAVNSLSDFFQLKLTPTAPAPAIPAFVERWAANTAAMRRSIQGGTVCAA